MDNSAGYISAACLIRLISLFHKHEMEEPRHIPELLPLDIYQGTTRHHVQLVYVPEWNQPDQLN